MSFLLRGIVLLTFLITIPTIALAHGGTDDGHSGEEEPYYGMNPFHYFEKGNTQTGIMVLVYDVGIIIGIGLMIGMVLSKHLNTK